MVTSLTIYHTDQREAFFIDTLRTNGLYAQLARRTVPGFLGVDLLRNSSSQVPSEFLLFTYWTSLDAYSAAQKTTNAMALAHFLSKLTVFSADLGVYFTLPDRLIPRFPGVSMANHTEKQSGDELGPTFNQEKAAGDSGANIQL